MQLTVTPGRDLVAGTTTLFSALPPTITVDDDPLGNGVFFRFTAEHPAATHEMPIGAMPALARYTCTYRPDLYWMQPRAGSDIGAVPRDTQFFLGQLTDGRFVVCLPLIDGWFRCALQGNGDGALSLYALTADPGTVGREFTGLLVGVGDDPYRLIAGLAESAVNRMRTGRLRRHKPLPAMVDSFGWCTWDAFYGEVSHEKVLEGLESFKRGGISPKFVLIDDGWLSVNDHTITTKRLTSFAANAKFPGDLGELVKAVKQTYGVDYLFVWHAMCGYWGGVDSESLSEYHVDVRERRLPPGSEGIWPAEFDNFFCRHIGLVSPDDIGHFFNAFHRHLCQQGVDGVKVDCQAILELLGDGLGGRVELMRAYREALEGSAHTHFLGGLINCMSCSNEMIFTTLNSNLTRSSTDFWPKRPESHGLHLYTNAQTSLWMGEFVHPDWDMFQSGHELGPLHAAARAVSGSPVYVSDRPDSHNFELLRKLVLSNGQILRAKLPGRPTADCLFADPTREDVPLKIFNLNELGGVVGAYNCRYDEATGDRPALSGTVSPADVAGLDGDRFAVYAHQAGTLVVLGRDESLPFELGPAGYEIFTIVPIRRGLAPIGLVEKFNSGAALTNCHTHSSGVRIIELRDGGRFVAWCEREPRDVIADGKPHEYEYDQATGKLTIELPVGGRVGLEFFLQAP